MSFLITALGLVILVLAGDALVRGAVNISLRLGVPSVIVGLTIVAFGTSAPELLIAIKAVLKGLPDIAMGNVVGSNTANILLVLGLPALMAGLGAGGREAGRSYLFMMGVSVLFIALCLFGPIGPAHAAVLLVTLAALLYDNWRTATAHRTAVANGAPPEDLEGADPGLPLWRILLYLGLGLVGLPLGAQLFLDGATEIAQQFGVSELVIGLTLVAVGTSLPELATTVMAAIRREADVAIGNVIGSNIFNLLGIIGVTGMVAPIPVAPEFLLRDLWVMLAASALIAPFVLLRWRIGRFWGLAFTAGYALYLWVLAG